MSDTANNNAFVAEQNRKTRTYTLFILFLFYTFNFIDRQILVILQEPIKADLGLSDKQLGLLTGFSFAIFYVTAGIPIARLADRSNRRNIMAACLTIWSGMTALSGLVTSYAQLVLARIGVGIGEAGCSPPAHSMISDMYDRKERSTALSIYSTGIYFGILLGFLIGGYVAADFGWRMTFFIVGLPGILLAVVMMITVKEPLRRMHSDQGSITKQTLFGSLKIFWQKPSFRYFSMGCAMSGFVSYGTGNFMPSYLARSHGMEISDIGLWLSMINGFGGMIGTYLGGVLTDKFGDTDKRWYCWIPALGAIGCFPLYFWIFTTNQTELMLYIMPIPFILATFYLGPAIASAHMIVSPVQRAMASAVLFFILNLIGLGLGPLAIGAISDYLMPTYGAADGLRYALMAGTSIIFVKAWLFYKGGQHLPNDIIQVDGK